MNNLKCEKLGLNLEIICKELRYSFIENLKFRVNKTIIDVSKYLKNGWRVKDSGGYYTDFNEKIIHVMFIKLLSRKDQRLHIFSTFHEIAHHKLHNQESSKKYSRLQLELEAWTETINLLRKYKTVFPRKVVLLDHIFDSIKSQIDK